MLSTKTGTRRNNAVGRIFSLSASFKTHFEGYFVQTRNKCCPGLKTRDAQPNELQMFSQALPWVLTHCPSGRIMRPVHDKLKSFVASVMFKLELVQHVYIPQVASPGKH